MLKKIGLVGLAFLAILGTAKLTQALVVRFNAYLVNEAGLTYSKNYILPVNSYGIEDLAFTSVASSVTFSNQTFTDGQVSTGSITVTTNSGLAASAASANITVATATVATDPGSTAAITINQSHIYNGLQWVFDTKYTTMTAESIKNAVNANVPGIVATRSGSVVYATASVSGSWANNMTLSVNFATTTIYTSSTNFSGGKDQVALSIGGYAIPYTVGAGSTNTAASIAAGILSTTLTNTLSVSTAGGSGSVVYATSSAVGTAYNYTMTSSSQNALTLKGVFVSSGVSDATYTMSGGKDASYTLVSGSATVINIANHGFPVGLSVYFTTASATGITGLTYNTTYYVVPVTPNAISLSATSTGAVAGTPLIVLSSSQTKTSADTFTLNVSSITGTPAYSWESSDDGMTWAAYSANSDGQSIATVSLASYVSTGTVTAWDFGKYGHAYLRLKVTGPTTGAIKLQVSGNGKSAQ